MNDQIFETVVTTVSSAGVSHIAPMGVREEETNNHSEKDTIASVYLNRLKIGMPLQADPTLKFAVKDLEPVFSQPAL